MHLRLTVGHFGLVLGGHFGGEVVARPVAPLDKAEADQKRAKTGVGRYPHGGACFPKSIPVLQGGKFLPPPPPQPPPLASAAGALVEVVAQKESKSKLREKQFR